MGVADGETSVGEGWFVSHANRNTVPIIKINVMDLSSLFFFVVPFFMDFPLN